MTTSASLSQEKTEYDGSSVIVLEIVAFCFFILSFAASIVMMLLSLPAELRGTILRGTFPPNMEAGPWQPEASLWLLFSFSVGFTILLNALGAPKRRRRWYWKLYGRINVVLGFLCAAEIFLLHAFRQTINRSLWWLLAVITVLGAVAVYLTEKFNRLEAAKAKREAEEALIKEQRQSPQVFRFKMRRYYVSENKTFVCKD